MRGHHYAFLYSAILLYAVMISIKGKTAYFRDKDAMVSFRNHFWQVAHEKIKKVVFEYEIAVFDHAPTSYK